MRRDRLAFAVRVRSQVDGVGVLGHFLQLGQDLFFAWNDDVIRFKIIIYIDTQFAFGQIFDVAQRSLDFVALAQVFLDGIRLVWLFDDDFTFGQIFIIGLYM